MAQQYQHVNLTETEVDDDSEEEEEDTVKENEAVEAYYWEGDNALPLQKGEVLAYKEHKYYFLAIKTIKILTYLTVFALVLGTSVISKITVLLMTSQLRPGTSRTLCHEGSRRHRREVDISLEERIQWTWALLFCFMIPEIRTFIQSCYALVFKKIVKPTFKEFIIPLIFEILHVVGLGLLTFIVLPSVHIVKATMMGSAVSFVPGLLSLLSRGPETSSNNSKRIDWIVPMAIDFISLVGQIIGLFFWTTEIFKEDKYLIGKEWLFPLAVILTSFGWWENFTSKNSHIDLISKLGNMRDRLEITRPFSYGFISLFKIVTFFSTMCLSIWLVGEDDPYYYFSRFNAAFTTRTLNVTELNQPISEGVTAPSAMPSLGGTLIVQKTIYFENSQAAVDYTILVQFLAAWICFLSAKFACKIRIQGISFALPLLLSVPVTMAVLISMCGLRDDDVCFARSILPDYLFWTCPSGSFTSDFVTTEYGWIWILLYLGQIWTALHIWSAASTRLAPDQVLFCTPSYNSLLTDSGLVFNRQKKLHPQQRRSRKRVSVSKVYLVDDQETNLDDVEVIGARQMPFGRLPPGRSNIVDSGAGQSQSKLLHSQEDDDKIPNIIACATLWHENRKEMMSMFKSIFRMYADQNARRVAINAKLGGNEDLYYKFEAQIFFDDAFQAQEESKTDPKQNENNPTPVINTYVQDMLDKCIDEAASSVHGVDLTIGKPKVIPTPYGGRLEWALPGDTKLTIHLKNKDKIRHKKRWSQVMYMYYLLRHKITGNDEYTEERKKLIARNTFILALDGDIDFQPSAVELLVDLMRNNTNLGAACGRIHPKGSGPMVWYQKFEYAIGHWLQKATEHMIGCVLCSPGCFSLFRAEGLMDTNVMKKYTTEPSEAKHYVQYDQGEDRWLCTLLLQQGWKVEYCAASDADTNAPETFNDFFIQRRRWVPSTMANIFDLIKSYKKTVKVNDNISLLYITYQLVLMIGGVLGPGTIFLMLVGALVAAFNIDNYTSLYYNLVPITLFILCCYFCKSKTQLKLAQLLSAVYALVMVAVLIALALQLVEDGLLAPSSIFLLAIICSFIVSGLVHPHEILCLGHGFIYYITIPSMYLLLIIFSLFNLNDVSWGTRENPVQVEESSGDEEEKVEIPKKKKKKVPIAEKVKNFLSQIIPDAWLGCRTRSETELTEVMNKLSDVSDKIEKQLNSLKDPSNQSQSSISSISENASMSSFVSESTNITSEKTTSTTKKNNTRNLNGKASVETTLTTENVLLKAAKRKDRKWLRHKLLRECDVEKLLDTEEKFWNELIPKFLKPIEKTKENIQKQKNIKADLLTLRNNVVAAFLLFNSLFVTAMFFLQLKKDKIFIEWPLGATHNMTFDDNIDTVTVTTDYLQLEPLGLVFVGFYAIIMVVQFLAMLSHRFETYALIMSATVIEWIDGASANSEHTNKMENNEFVTLFQKIKPVASTVGSSEVSKTSRRKSMLKSQYEFERRKSKIQTLDKVYNKRVQEIQKIQQVHKGPKGKNVRSRNENQNTSTFFTMIPRATLLMKEGSGARVNRNKGRFPMETMGRRASPEFRSLDLSSAYPNGQLGLGYPGQWNAVQRDRSSPSVTYFDV